MGYPTARCECPDLGRQGAPSSWYETKHELPFVNHEPGECHCTYMLRWYDRDGKRLLLCNICHLSGDILIPEAEA